MPRCCGCCSLRCVGGFVLVCALIPTVINPVLDALIADPLPVKDPSHVYVEGKTEVTDYDGLKYADPDAPTMKAFVGLSFILGQSVPRWFNKIITELSPMELVGHSNATRINTIFDARAVVEDYAKRGFTLHKMPRPPATDSYRTNIQPYLDDVEALVSQLHPDAKRVQFTYQVIRGGGKPGDQPPALNGPHLDYTQNDTARAAFHAEYTPMPGVREQHILLGEEDSPENGTFKIMLGIWKPINMNTPVCDHPLAVMDASTFRPEHDKAHHVHIDFGVFQFHNLNGGIVYDPAQRWYYYPHQTNEELLIFRHYTRGRFFATPHTSFLNTNCPNDAETRQSVELRAALYF